ncbi:MAG TPA: class I SAM-dependent methyltransferase [Flavitalea sp.]|nr:class I SAM-dependent methyltransferase [Flavitalea sp.]
MSDLFTSDKFPLSSKYNPEWIKASVSGGANPLLLTEWLCQYLDLRPGMRILDLGCGRAMSSIFLHHEFGVQVWAVDLWCSVAENAKRIEDAGMKYDVFPVHADARALPFAPGFFDAIIAIDCYFYFGTDDLYLDNITRFLKPGGQIAIAGAGLMQEIKGNLPEHLQQWWTKDLWCLHSANWWKRHWEKVGLVDIECCDSMQEGWRLWIKWHQAIAPDNKLEIEALTADEGRYLGYVRVVARKKINAVNDEPILAIPSEYTKKPLLRG